MDDYKGPVRWHICFNFTILRSISYGLDIYTRKNPIPVKKYNQKDKPKEIDPNSHIKVNNIFCNKIKNTYLLGHE